MAHLKKHRSTGDTIAVVTSNQRQVATIVDKRHEPDKVKPGFTYRVLGYNGIALSWHFVKLAQAMDALEARYAQDLRLGEI